MHTSRRCSTLAVAGLALALGAAPAGAASHREAPLMTLDPAPRITEWYGPKHDGMENKQRYTVTALRNCKDKKKGPKCKDKTVLFGGQSKPAVPSNIGPRTMPDYAALAAKGIFTDTDTGIRVL